MKIECKAFSICRHQILIEAVSKPQIRFESPPEADRFGLKAESRLRRDEQFILNRIAIPLTAGLSSLSSPEADKMGLARLWRGFETASKKGRAIKTLPFLIHSAINFASSGVIRPQVSTSAQRHRLHRLRYSR